MLSAGMARELRWVVAIAGVLAAAGYVAWLAALPAPDPSGAVGFAAPVDSGLGMPAVAATTPAARRAADASAFASFGEDGEPIRDPIRAGLCLLVRDPVGAPQARVPITVKWRKGPDSCGRDAGTTDADGAFPTTVAEPTQIEGVELEHDAQGHLEYHGEFFATAEDARRVLVVVPAFAPLLVMVIDPQGVPHAGATVVAFSDVSQPPRAHVVTPERRQGTTDGAGRCVLSLPLGSAEVLATSADAAAPEHVVASLDASGGSATIVVIPHAQRTAVTVAVTAPPGAELTLQAASAEPPPRRPDWPGRGGRVAYREFGIERRSAREFVVLAEPVAWDLQVLGTGCAGTVMRVAAGQRAVAVELQAAPPATTPKAVVVVTLVDATGKPVRGDVAVHGPEDPVYGRSQTTDDAGRLVLELEPGRRVCLRGRRPGCAPAIVGPFDLDASIREVRIELPLAMSLAGVVLDEQGALAPATVLLQRPSGALQQLGAGVRPFLNGVQPNSVLQTGAEARFHFDDCQSGDHELWAYPTAGGWPGRVRARPGDAVCIVLGRGLEDLVLVTATVREATTRAPLAGASVDCAEAQIVWGIPTDGAGSCRFVAPAGALQVRALARDHAVARVDVAAARPGRLALEVLLAPSPVLFLRVVDRSGQPLAGVAVQVLDAARQPIELLDPEGNSRGKVEVCDRVGEANVRGAPAGALTLRLACGDELREFAVAAGAGRLERVDLRWQ